MGAVSEVCGKSMQVSVGKVCGCCWRNMWVKCVGEV